jgi:hypothetical protein
MGIAEVILASARVERRETDRLYCVGPPSGRLSFMSQQMRAMNLVWALGKTGKIEPGMKVGVVGGGIAGLTAAMTLRAQRCHVTVYEKSKAVLHRQRGATHRHAHPSINWWPTESELLPTTSLPFLNWGMGQCNRIVDAMMSQWARLEKESGPSLKVESENVTEAIAVLGDKNRLTLKSSNKSVGKGFDVVIVASGFGEENSVEGLQRVSYWQPDDLEDKRNNPGSIDLFVVSGFGDGGLLDALRIAYDFRSGALSFDLAQLINGTGVGEGMAKAGHDAVRWQELAKRLFDEEGQGSVWSNVGALLAKALRGEPGDVLLIDQKLETPFHGSGAPIHKLMIAYAVHRGVVFCRKGELKPAGADGRYMVGDQERGVANTYFIVRHGARPYHGGLISDAEWEKLMTVAENARTYSFKPAWHPGELEVPDGWPCPTREPERFVDSVYEDAARTWKEISPTSHMAPKDKGFVVTGHNTAYKPQTFFGLPVEYRAAERTGSALDVA